MSTFGKHIRELRKRKCLTQKELAGIVGIDPTYLSKIENNKLQKDQFPRECTIIKLAESLDSNLDELMLLAKRVPETIRSRIIERPDAFLAMASVDDATLDRILDELDKPT